MHVVFQILLGSSMPIPEREYIDRRYYKDVAITPISE